MKLKRNFASVVAAACCCLLLARSKAASMVLPRPQPMYFSLLAGPHGKPALLIHADIALSPGATSVDQMLASYAAAHHKGGHPRWIAAQVSHLLKIGRGAETKPLFARTPTAASEWRFQFSTPKSIFGALTVEERANFRIPWEIKAGPLAGCGWLLLPTPGDGRRKRLAGFLGGTWGAGAESFAFAMRRHAGTFHILGYGDLARNDPFAAVIAGFCTTHAAPPCSQPYCVIGDYARVGYRATRKGCLLAQKGEKADFSLFFRLRPVPKALLTEIREFRNGTWPPKRAILPTGNAERTATKPKADPFDLATTYFLKRVRGLKPVWFIAGRSVYYALFSGEYLGKHSLWLMKLRKSTDGFEWYGLTQGLLKHACPDGLLGSDSAITPTDAFLAKKFLKAKASDKRAAILHTQLQTALILAQEQEKLAAAALKPPAKPLIVPGLARISPRNVVWRIGAPATPQMVIVTIPKSHPFHITAVQTGDTFMRAKLVVIAPQRRYAIVLWPKSTSGIAGWMVMAKTDFLQDGKPAWLKIPVEVFPPPIHPKR